jgi:hypothetical protein
MQPAVAAQISSPVSSVFRGELFCTDVYLPIGISIPRVAAKAVAPMQWYAFACIQFGFRPAGELEASDHDLQESRKHHEAVAIEQVAMST